MKRHVFARVVCYRNRVTTADRTIWSLVATILQVVALVVMAAGAGVHGHGGGTGKAHVHAGSHAHSEIQTHAHGRDGSPERHGVTASGERATLDVTAAVKACTCGSTTCMECCHVHSMQPGAPTVGRSRTFGRVLASVRAIAFASIVIEHPAEPPRTFA